MLSPAAAAAADKALAAVRADAVRWRAEADASGGPFTSLFSDFIGTDSAAAARRSTAGQAERDAARFEARRLTLSDDAAAAAFIEDARSTVTNPALFANLPPLNVSSAAAIVARDTAKTAAEVAVGVGQSSIMALLAAPWVLLGLAVLFVWTKARRHA